MTLPLIVLAAFSTVAGLIGIPHALTFGANLNVFEKWLEPAIVQVDSHSATAGHGAAAAAAPAAGEHAEAAHAPISPWEYVLMFLSVGIAVAGIMFARFLYVKRTELPDIWARKLRPLYNLSANKWYWDYLLDQKGVEAGKQVNSALWKVDAAVVDGGVNGAGWLTRFWARMSGLWDKWVIDLAVNATARVTYWSSFVFRAFQTGLWQNYALLFALGLFIILLLYVYSAIPTTIKGYKQ
jgi:NADH-quinone oxidoreductase subunit L